jgi:hypothetical protein
MAMVKPTSRIKQIEEENQALKYIIAQTLWMARRYADGRSSYAVGMLNDAVHELDRTGLSHLFTGDPAEDYKRFADDGMFGKYDSTTRTFKKED